MPRFLRTNAVITMVQETEAKRKSYKWENRFTSKSLLGLTLSVTNLFSSTDYADFRRFNPGTICGNLRNLRIPKDNDVALREALGGMNVSEEGCA